MKYTSPQSTQLAKIQRKKRAKERCINEVIEQVFEWRKYAYEDNQTIEEKEKLQKAARQIRISRKSLDDYLNQLRNGQEFDFNFDKHEKDKIGVLRQHNWLVSQIHEIWKQNQKNESKLFEELRLLKLGRKVQKIIKYHQQKEDEFCCYIGKISKILNGVI